MRVIDPRRFSGPRDASKIKSQYRSLRSAHTVSNERHKGTGKNAWGKLKLHGNGEARFVYIYCLLFGTPVMGLVLRTIPLRRTM